MCHRRKNKSETKLAGSEERILIVIISDSRYNSLVFFFRQFKTKIRGMFLGKKIEFKFKSWKLFDTETFKTAFPHSAHKKKCEKYLKRKKIFLSMQLLTQKKGFLRLFRAASWKKSLPYKVNEAFLLLINNCIFQLNSR